MPLKKEIGGKYNLPFKILWSKKRNKLSKKYIYLGSGRDSIELIIRALNIKKGDNILLPSYLCESIMDQFKKNKINIIFYKVNKNLIVDLKNIQNKIKNKKIKAIIIIHYFGFIQPKIEKINKFCEKNNIILIEDIVQSALTKYKPRGKIYFNSYRKILPIPEGSTLNFEFKLKRIPNKKSFTHFLFVYSGFLATLLKNIPLLEKLSHHLVDYNEKKLINYPKPAKMSKISKFLLKKQDMDKIAIIRRRNFKFLLGYLNKNKNIKPLFSTLPNNVVPLDFPIILKTKEMRKNLKQVLIKNKIYPPIHWKLPKEIDKKEFRESWDISQRILTIPADQRYKLKDMERIIKIIKKENKNG
jgi:dTDP-4-amino-4,6-dideoxygalactose transaminase